MDLATLADLKARLDWDLDQDELRIAAGALEDASELARHYGGRPWADPASAPRAVRSLVLRAASRYMRNPDGYVTSRAGDETLGWNDSAGENAGTVYFTIDEQKLLVSLGGKRPGMATANVVVWGTKLPPDGEVGYVPVSPPGKPFPFFSTPDGPW